MAALFLLFICIFISTLADRPAENDMRKMKDQCVAQLKLDNAKHENMPSIEEGVVLNHDEKCLMKCILEKLGHFDEDGKLNEDKLKHEMPERSASDFQVCYEGVSDDPCDRIYEVVKCVTDMSKNLHKRM